MVYYIDKQEFEDEVINFQTQLRKIHKEHGCTDEIIGDRELYRAWKRKLKDGVIKYGLHLVSNKLSKMIIDLTTNNLKAYKYRNNDYDDKKDIEGQVVLEMLKVLNSYNPKYFQTQDDKEPNAFGYYTQSVQRCITKQLMQINEHKAKKNEMTLFLDDTGMDFGNDDDNANFKMITNTTREYINSLDGNDLLHYKKTKNRLPKPLLKQDNIDNLKCMILGINQYHDND